MPRWRGSASRHLPQQVATVAAFGLRRHPRAGCRSTPGARSASRRASASIARRPRCSRPTRSRASRSAHCSCSRSPRCSCGSWHAPALPGGCTHSAPGPHSRYSSAGRGRASSPRSSTASANSRRVRCASAVESLARRCGFEPRGVYVMDGSRRSTHGNAYFTGLGRNKRIVFFDTLLAALAPAELQAVLAHELGHYRLRHVALAARAVARGCVRGLRPARLARPGSPGSSQRSASTAGGPHTLLLLFGVAAPAFLFGLRPLAALALAPSRVRGRPATPPSHADAAALADALVKLYRDNASTLTPDPLYTAFHASHPPALARIARLAPDRHA